MILIITQDGDTSTYDICDWLKYYKQDFLIINGDKTKLSFQSYNLSNKEIDFVIKLGEKEINSKNTKVFFWRRGYLSNNFNFYNKNKVFEAINEHLYKEKESLLDSLIYSFENLSGKISNYFFNEVENELISLQIAKKSGLNIPDTLVTTKIDELQKFKNKNKTKIITKAISNGINIEIDKKIFSQYTEKIDEFSFRNGEDEFFPTLFQEQLDKKYELRIFYIDRKCYTMAIFSQQDEQTSIDFRHYNNGRPNRNVPFNLPKQIISNISRFMEFYNADSGSIDMVYTKDGRYVFLEVNPVGQFGMVSEPCNYLIERDIAEKLITKVNE